MAGDDNDTVEVEADEVLLVGERRDLDFDEMCLGELKIISSLVLYADFKN